MPGNPRVEYEVAITKTGSGAADAANDLKKVEGAAEKTRFSLGALKSAFSGVAVGLLLRSSIQQLQEAERASAKLQNALKSTGQYSKEAFVNLKALAETLAEGTSFDDDSIVSALGVLVGYGAKTQDLERLGKAVLNISAFMDRDLRRAAIGVGQALNGDLSVFKQLNITLDDTKAIAGQVEDALKAVEGTFGNASQSPLGTFNGDLERADKALNDLKKSFGGLLSSVAPEISGVTDLLKQMARMIEKLREGDVKGALGEAFEFKPPGKPAFSNPFKTPVVDPADEETRDMLRGMLGFPMRHPPKGSPTPTHLPGGPVDLGATPAVSFTAQAGEAGPREVSESDAAMKKRFEAARAVLANEMQMVIEGERYRDAAVKRAEERSDDLSLREVENARRVNDEEQSLRNETVLAQLSGFARVQAQAEIDHQDRLRRIRSEEVDNEEQYNRLIDAENQRHGVVMSNLEREHTVGIASWTAIADNLKVQIASGIGGALVDSFEKGGEAWKNFARTLFRDLAKAIFQAIIFKALFGATGGGGLLGSLFGGGGSGGGGLSGITSGGAAFTEAGGGFGKLSSLGPRLSQVNIPSILGAGAGARAGAGVGGAGGQMMIHVTLSPELKSEMIESSIKGAEAKVTQSLGQNTKLSRAARRLNT